MKWYYNMKIGAKLLLGFIVVAIIAGVVGLIGIYNLNKMNTDYSDLYDNYGVPLGDIANASNYYQQIRIGLRDLLIEEDSEQLNVIVEKISTNDNLMKEALTDFKTSLQTQDEIELIPMKNLRLL